jgi:hypothetical protein
MNEIRTVEITECPNCGEPEYWDIVGDQCLVCGYYMVSFHDVKVGNALQEERAKFAECSRSEDDEFDEAAFRRRCAEHDQRKEKGPDASTL